MKHRKGNKQELGKKSKKIKLKNGSLLLMKGSFQENWQHHLLPTKRDVGRKDQFNF
jgi:alkylated DNA repair dioxygenase AlkB